LPSATITDVARHAGVAPSTVSYVLSGNRSISEETQARVRRAIEELDYRPHAGARSLRAGKTDVVALVVPFYDWFSEPVIMPYIYGVVDAARQHGWNVMLVTGGRGESDVDDVLGSKMVDGVVLMEVRVDDERLKLIEQLALPAVLLGMPSEPGEVPFVDFDFESAGRLCVQHLVALGHSHIGLVASPPGTFEKKLGYAHRLWRGVAGGLQEAGLAFHGLPMEPNLEGAHQALDTLFKEKPALSALIVHSEGMIDLFMQALEQRGKAVPADISVIAVGWGELTKHVVPPLTYVNVPAVEMGRTAIELLAEDGPGTLLPAGIVAGSTVAPPPTT
jgi:DNA-binding LacI/PurR family transcriptional regulator